ncbi:MAG: fatty acid desaturase family protein [Planctomycetia bacterium]
MSDLSVRFAPPQGSPFTVELKQEVTRYFEERGLSDKGGWRSWVRAVVMLGLVFGPWALVLAGVLTGWWALAACVVMGVGVAGVGFAVGHDAQHGAFSSRPWVNRVVGLSFDLMGASGYLWRFTHNRIHHTFTNMHGLDEDIVVSPALRLSRGSKHRGWHRIQHLTCWPLYSLTTLNWLVLKDFDFLLRGRVGPYAPPTYPRLLWPAVLLGKLACLSWQLVIPWLVLQPSPWQLLAGFLVMHMTAGLILALVFQLAHVVEGMAFPQPGAGERIGDTWAEHQLRTTADFSRDNWLLGWYCGGLNFQVEHHLFPHVASEHYAALAPIVEACAQRHGLAYHHAPSFGTALASHVRLLRDLGAPERAPAHAA